MCTLAESLHRKISYLISIDRWPLVAHTQHKIIGIIHSFHFENGKEKEMLEEKQIYRWLFSFSSSNQKWNIHNTYIVYIYSKFKYNKCVVFIQNYCCSMNRKEDKKKADIKSKCSQTKKFMLIYLDNQW